MPIQICPSWKSILSVKKKYISRAKDLEKITTSGECKKEYDVWVHFNFTKTQRSVPGIYLQLIFYKTKK